MSESLEQHALLPCPFCGDVPISERIEPHRHFIANMPDYPGAWSIECVQCEFRLFDHESEENARNKWNRRLTAEQAQQEPVAVEWQVRSAPIDGIIAGPWMSITRDKYIDLQGREKRLNIETRELCAAPVAKAPVTQNIVTEAATRADALSNISQIYGLIEHEEFDKASDYCRCAAERYAPTIMLAASPSTPPAQDTQDMVLVPRDPTEAMLIAARDWSNGVYGKPIGNDAARGCWQAMLYASHSPTTPDQDAAEARARFEKWWETAVKMPPYSNPKEIARSAWFAAMLKEPK